MQKIALRKTSFIDYPGKVSCALFFEGCNLRCPWCHNRELVLDAQNVAETLVSLDKALAHIYKRRALLKGVVLSGGEPTLAQDLPDLIKEIKSAGLAAKLDTNGMRPEILEKLLEKTETSPDYIALDLKFAPERYAELLPENAKTEQTESRSKNSAASLKKSAEIIRISGVEHEYRTLALPIIKEEDIDALAELADGAAWYVRPFKPGNCLAPEWDFYPASSDSFVRILTDRIKSRGKNGLLKTQESVHQFSEILR